MPISDSWAVPWVMEVVNGVRPASLLDFGVGMGEYGFHIRQSLDIGDGLLHRDKWKRRIDGVDVFPDYKNPIWEYYYNEVVVADGRTVLERTSPGKYDMIIACDVIEHFDTADALAVIRRMREIAPWVVITTPNGHYSQGTLHGNEAETHRSHWKPSDFEEIGGSVTPIGVTFMTIFASDQRELRARELDNLPVLFRHTGRSMAQCFRRWFPRMIRSRTGLGN